MNKFWQYKADHILFWVLTVYFHLFTRLHLLDTAGFPHFLLEIILRNGMLAIVIYVNLHVLIPRFLQQKKYLAYIVLLLAALAWYVVVKDAHDAYLHGYVLGDEAKKGLFNNSFYNLSIVIFYVVFSVALHLSKEWYFQREQIRKIEIEKLNAELDYLKSQINPHFLFNSINTIYFQIDKNNALARETLSKFSDMLRYQIYECNGNFIPVKKEIEYLKNYVALQRLRKDENYAITLSGAESADGFELAPLLLIPFVENAFKHISHHSNSPNEIQIRVDRKGRIFSFHVFNTCDTKAVNQNEWKGIGLQNVKRRLELLYPKQHVLEIQKTSNSFEVSLEIEIPE